MDQHLMFWLVIKILQQIVSCLIFYVIWKYLSSKPLGHRTILDVLIKDNIVVCTTCFITVTFIYLKFVDVYSHEAATIILMINQSAMTAFLLQLMVTNVIRYLYIFHPGFMHDTKDQTIMRATRTYVGLGSVASAFLNDYGKGGIEYSYLTNSETDGFLPHQNKFWFFRGILVLNILLLIVAQARIEMFKNQTNPIQLYRKPKNKHSVIGNKSLAITFALVLIGLVIFLDLVLFPDNINMAAHGLRTRVILSVIMNILLPIIWIRKNKKLHQFFFRAFCSHGLKVHRATAMVEPNV